MPDVTQEVIIEEVKCLDEIMDVREELGLMQAVFQDQERVMSHVKAEAFFKAKPEIAPIRFKPTSSKRWGNDKTPSQPRKEGEETSEKNRQTYQEWIDANPDTLYDQALRQIQYSTHSLDHMERHADEVENSVSDSLKIIVF